MGEVLKKIAFIKVGTIPVYPQTKDFTTGRIDRINLTLEAEINEGFD